MSRPYGKRKVPMRGKSGSAPASQAVEVQVNLTIRHTMEQLALEVQRALAMVQDFGAAGVEKFRFRLLPLDETGTPIALHDGHGQQVLVLNIPEAPVATPYRPDEPGVGITTTTSPHSLASPRTYP